MDYKKIIEKAFNDGVKAQSDAKSFIAMMSLEKKAKEYAEQQVNLFAIPAVINRRELLVAFILWYWFKCENKETREAGDLIDEFLATNSL